MGYEVLTLLSLTTVALSGLLVVLGLVFIKTGRRELHKRAMISASFLALLFLVFYGLKYFLYPPKYYHGPYREVYLFFLLSHSVLATLNLPLAAVTVFLGLTGRYSKHRKVAPVTALVWLYVAVSGWIVFFFLRAG